MKVSKYGQDRGQNHCEAENKRGLRAKDSLIFLKQAGDMYLSLTRSLSHR